MTDATVAVQRPVNWILWSTVTGTAAVIIPEEAERVIPIVGRAGSRSPTHLVVYAAPITRKMQQFNELQYFSVPPLPRTWSAPGWLKVELGIFAGRLYFGWDE